MNVSLSFQGFREEWLSDILLEDTSTTELGHRFAHKLITQWLDIDASSDDIIYCDGSGDGGIDIAYLSRSESENTGHTWYLVQSKYGKAFRGTSTILSESQKVIDTLDGQRKKLSSLTQSLLERLVTFRQQSSDLDRIKLVFATENPLTDEQRKALTNIQLMGIGRLGPLFDVDAISIQNIYLRNKERSEVTDLPRLHVPIKAELASSGEAILLGLVPLLSLYAFLKEYKAQTGDLNQLYEKNVRQFLEFNRGKVNKGIRGTLRSDPEKFGLFNNGITIVVEDFYYNQDGTIELVEPNIVNGCQTSQTLWHVCVEKLEAGGTGAANKKLKEWKDKATHGIVMTKIVKVGIGGEQLLQDIIRFTNTQNAIQEKDYLALTTDCKVLADEMAKKYSLFLEIQRGSWDAYRARQKQNPSIKHYDQAANFFELVKVYGAGWLGEAGNAWSTNSYFLPGGKIYKAITENTDFGVDDLYAAYRLQCEADSYKFGRGAKISSRKLTKFLYYLVVLELLRGVMVRAGLRTSLKDVTYSLLKLFNHEDNTPIDTLLDTSLRVIDVYLNDGVSHSVFREPTMNGNVNAYLKSGDLGKKDFSPCLNELLESYQAGLSIGIGGKSPDSLIIDVIRESKDQVDINA